MSRLLAFAAGLICGVLILQLSWLIVAAVLVLCWGLLLVWFLLAAGGLPVLSEGDER